MVTYYKVVNSGGMFQKTYNISDIKSIPEGSQFVASDSYGFVKTSLSDNTPLLYFTDCAFDMMLWYPIFSKTPYLEALAGNIRESCIYEIIPLSQIVKGRSPSDHNFFRCGANKIEFKKQIPIEQVAKIAIQEYNQHKWQQYWVYGRKYVKDQVALWQKKYLK